MPEQIDLTTPIVPATTTYYRVAALSLDWPGQRIGIVLRSTAGEDATFSYTGQTAVDLMVILNTANLTSNSLHRRILARLIADGKLSGTITGSP